MSLNNTNIRYEFAIWNKEVTMLKNKVLNYCIK